MVLDTALSATGLLSGETSECIRGGIAGPVADAMNSLFLPSPRSEDEGAPLLAVLFLALACMNEEEFNAAVQIAGGLIPEDWSFMQCTVDAVGPTDVAALFLGSVDQEDLSPKEQSALEGCLTSADPLFPTTPTPAPPITGPLADLVWDTAVMLAWDLSPRESSTQEELRAAEYLAGQFSRWGYEVQVQEFETIDHGDATRLVMLTPDRIEGDPGYWPFDNDEDQPWMFSYPLDPWSVSATGEYEISGQLAYAGHGTEDDFKGVELTGKIALMEWGGGVSISEKVDLAAEAGAEVARLQR